MAHSKQSALFLHCKDLRDRIDHWRKTRLKCSAMPVALWETAISLATTYGVCPVARAVGLDYKTLRQRVAENRKGEPESSEPVTGFLEVRAAQLVGATASESVGSLVELCGPDGAKLSIRLSEHQTVDVLGLAREFWGRRP